MPDRIRTGALNMRTCPSIAIRAHPPTPSRCCGHAAEAGILQGADETEADPVPIADPLRAAGEIDREEEERGEVRPVGLTPEPGDVTPIP